MEHNKFYKVFTKNCTCYYFDDIIRLEDFDFDNIFIDEKSYKNILIYNILYKTLIDRKPLRLTFDKTCSESIYIRMYKYVINSQITIKRRKLKV